MDMKAVRCPECNAVLLQMSVYESRSSLDWVKCRCCKQRIQVMAHGEEIRLGVVDVPVERVAG